jgi:hypothetical protein
MFNASTLSLSGFLIGIVVTLFGGAWVRLMMYKVRSEIRALNPPESKESHDYLSAHPIVGEFGERVIGRLERLVMFVSFWLDSWPLVLGWLAFKAVTCWTWGTLSANASYPFDGDARDGGRFWTSWTLMLVLASTAANLLVGLLGAVVGHGAADIALAITE